MSQKRAIWDLRESMWQGVSPTRNSANTVYSRTATVEQSKGSTVLILTLRHYHCRWPYPYNCVLSLNWKGSSEVQGWSIKTPVQDAPKSAIAFCNSKIVLLTTKKSHSLSTDEAVVRLGILQMKLTIKENALITACMNQVRQQKKRDHWRIILVKMQANRQEAAAKLSNWPRKCALDSKANARIFFLRTVFICW